MQELAHELGSRPDLDLVAKLFSPETSHEKIPENEMNTTSQESKCRSGCSLRSEFPFNHDDCGGRAGPDVARSLAIDLAEKLAKLENVKVDAKPVA